MPSSDDETHRFAATTELDFYELLSVNALSTPAEIRRQYRKTALKYHPDKNPSADAADKFQLLTTASDILLDPTLREIYENAYRQREKRRLEREALGKRRRDMISELEQDERGQGKKAKLDEELRMLRADGERRRRERDEANRKAFEDEARAAELAASIKADTAAEEPDVPEAPPSASDDLLRSVKVRWYKDSTANPEQDDAALREILAQAGSIESALSLKDKKNVSVSVFVFSSTQEAAAACSAKYPSWIKSVSSAAEKKKAEDVKTEVTEPISAAPAKGASYEKMTFARLREAAAKQKAKAKPESVPA